MTPSHQSTVIYARQSKDRQGTGLAVARQVEGCRQLIASRGWPEPREADVIIDNDTSATTGKRKGYSRLLELIEAGDVGVVVVWHMDRLLRSLAELEDLIVLAERTHTRVATVSGDLDLSTDAGRLVGRILGSVARGEVERKATRQRAAEQQRAKAGDPPVRQIFGYEPDGRTIIPEQAEAIRGAFESLFAGRSIYGITADLNAAGWRTTRGMPWSRVAVRYMLTNARYAAIRSYHRERVGPGTWPAIISEETHLAAVAMLDRARRPSDSTARRWLGSGIYQCGKCGESPVKIGYRKDKATGRYTEGAYRCRRYFHCSWLAADVDEYVLTAAAERLREPDAVRLLMPEAENGTSADALRVEAAGLRARIEGMGVDYAQGLLTGQQVAAATSHLNERVAEIDETLARLGRRHGLADLLAADDPGAELLGATLDVQRAALAQVATVTLLPIARPGTRPPIRERVNITFGPRGAA